MELDGNNSINFYKQVAPTGLFSESIIFIPGGEQALDHGRFLWKFILIVNEFRLLDQSDIPFPVKRQLLSRA